MLKKYCFFWKNFTQKILIKKKLNSFKAKFNENAKHRNHVLETILLLNEKFIDTEKSKILANLFSAYIEENLTWEEFFKMSFILTSLNPAGYKILEKSVDKDSAIKLKMHESIEGEVLLMACGSGYIFEQQFKPTKTAIKLYEYGLKPLKK